MSSVEEGRQEGLVVNESCTGGAGPARSLNQASELCSLRTAVGKERKFDKLAG